MHDDLGEALGMCLADLVDDVGIACCQRDTDSRFDEIYNGQSDEKRSRSNNLKEDERLDSDPADFFQRARAGDADHDR